MDMVGIITAAKAAQIMLKELASDIQHSNGVSNEEKSRLAAKCHDIQLLLCMAAKEAGGACTR